MGHAAEQLPRRSEPALFFRAIAQHPGHLIEMRRDFAELVITGERHLGREISLGDLLDPPLEGAERIPDAAPHDEQRDREQHRARDDDDDRRRGAEIPREREGQRRAIHHSRGNDDDNQYAEALDHEIKMQLLRPKMPLAGLLSAA